MRNAFLLGIFAIIGHICSNLSDVARSICLERINPNSINLPDIDTWLSRVTDLLQHDLHQVINNIWENFNTDLNHIFDPYITPILNIFYLLSWIVPILRGVMEHWFIFGHEVQQLIELISVLSDLLARIVHNWIVPAVNELPANPQLYGIEINSINHRLFPEYVINRQDIYSNMINSNHYIMDRTSMHTSNEFGNYNEDTRGLRATNNLFYLGLGLITIVNFYVAGGGDIIDAIGDLSLSPWLRTGMCSNSIPLS